MAFTTVVNNSFIQRMTEVLQELQKEKGDLTLAVMTPFDLGDRERWSLFLAAPWLDKIPLQQAAKVIRSYFLEKLGPFAKNYQQTFIVRTRDSEVRYFSLKFDVPDLGTAYRIIGLDGDRFENAILFVARPAYAETRDSLPLSA